MPEREAYAEQSSGNSSNISTGNGLTINAGSLTNVGSQISAGQSATINVTGPIVNSEQTLNAYSHSEWVQETSLFSSDQRHNIWACGSVAECTAIYGSAYTSVGGVIDPPTPVGNIAATIQATLNSGQMNCCPRNPGGPLPRVRSVWRSTSETPPPTVIKLA